jgi:uroporphyrin-III C-methyltransferase
MEDGVSPAMPVAIVERATLPGARAMRSLLADLGDLVAREHVESPAIIIVGDVVDHSLAEDRLMALADTAEKVA